MHRLFIAGALFLLGDVSLEGAVAEAAPRVRKVRVHYSAGPGDWISIRGSVKPLSWNSGVKATLEGKDTWVWAVPSEVAGFEFKPLLNDQKWSVGTNYPVAAGQGIDVYPFFGPAKGTLVPHTLKGGRKAIVYLPPSYSENLAKRYPVLYVHDGQNVFEATTAFAGVEWGIDEAMDRLIEKGTVREAIVVGIHNTADRMVEYTPTKDSKHGGGGAESYLDFLEKSVMPFVKAKYRILEGPASTFMMGSSLGGLLSFHAGWARSSVYGGVACLSSSFWWSDEAMTRKVGKHSGAKIRCRIYLDVGRQEPGWEQSERMRDALMKLGFEESKDLEYRLDPQGKHHESSWAARVHRPLEFLLRP